MPRPPPFHRMMRPNSSTRKRAALPAWGDIADRRGVGCVAVLEHHEQPDSDCPCISAHWVALIGSTMISEVVHKNRDGMPGKLKLLAQTRLRCWWSGF